MKFHIANSLTFCGARPVKVEGMDNMEWCVGIYSMSRAFTLLRDLFPEFHIVFKCTIPQSFPFICEAFANPYFIIIGKGCLPI